VRNTKISELSFMRPPYHVHSLNHCARRPLPAPFDKPRNILFGSFANDLHAAVTEIADKTFDVNSSAFLLVV